MTRYFVTVSWPDPNQPLAREYDSGEVEIENLSLRNSFDIVQAARSQNHYWRNREIAIMFMMPFGA